MNGDKAFDDFLSIDTMECIGAERPTEDNNIYQATYYRDLVTIFDMVSMEPEDTLVDMGRMRLAGVDLEDFRIF